MDNFILLTAMPRSGSKFIDRNLNEYIKQFRNKFNPKFKFQSLFCASATGQLMKVFSHGKVTEFEKFDDLLPLIDQDEMYSSLKIHPVTSFERDLILKLHPLAKIHIASVRENKFDQCISWAIMHKLNSWNADINLLPSINKLIDEPFIVNEEDFLSYSILYDTQYNFIKSIPNINYIDVNKLKEIKNSESFCEILGLEPVKFNLLFDYHIEYGSKKSRMIKNYSDLKLLI